MAHVAASPTTAGSKPVFRLCSSLHTYFPGHHVQVIVFNALRPRLVPPSSMGTAARVLITLIKIVPLGFYLRSIACGFDVPIFGCDEPLCPAAIGQIADDCFPTANTAELKAWCENGWTPWLNGLLAKVSLPAMASCNASNGFLLLRILGAIQLVSYILLWVMPTLGATLLTIYMCFAMHFHVSHLKEGAGAILLQMGLFTASITVLFLEVQEAENAPVDVKKTKKD